jgi:Luciferase-like monooxygenase
MPLTYAFRLAPGPQALDQAMLAEKLGYERVWSPEVPAFGHDIWVHLARIAERTQRIGIGPAVLIPSYRHPVAQASAIATLEHIAPGRLMVAFGTGFTGRIALGQKPLSWEAMRRHLLQVRALLRGEAVDIDGGMAQLLASSGLLPDRPIRTPLLLAAQGPKGRAVAKEIADGLVALRDPGLAPASASIESSCRRSTRRARSSTPFGTYKPQPPTRSACRTRRHPMPAASSRRRAATPSEFCRERALIANSPWPKQPVSRQLPEDLRGIQKGAGGDPQAHVSRDHGAHHERDGQNHRRHQGRAGRHTVPPAPPIRKTQGRRQLIGDSSWRQNGALAAMAGQGCSSSGKRGAFRCRKQLSGSIPAISGSTHSIWRAVMRPSA